MVAGRQGPDHTRLFDVKATGELGDLGITELHFESAEPSPAEVLERFPPGEYVLLAASVDGEVQIGRGSLSRALPAAPVIRPESGQVVPAAGLAIEWQAAGGVAAYEVVVSNEDSRREMSVELPAEATRLDVPEAFVQPRTSYKAEVIAIDGNGNKTITIAEFSTR